MAPIKFGESKNMVFTASNPVLGVSRCPSFCGNPQDGLGFEAVERSPMDRVGVGLHLRGPEDTESINCSPWALCLGDFCCSSRP